MIQTKPKRKETLKFSMDAKKSHENKDLDLSSTVASEDVTVDEGYASRNGESFIDDSTVFPHSPSLVRIRREYLSITRGLKALGQ